MPGNDARQEALNEPPPHAAGAAIERVAATASTNDDLLARVRAAHAAGASEFATTLLVTDRQTGGRGRHGRRWHAEPGRSLTFSIAWQPRRSDLSGLSLAIGAALADALEPPVNGVDRRIGIKWPNDLWLRDEARSLAGGKHVARARGDAAAAEPNQHGGRKLAGILVETAPLANARVAVIGIGINVMAQAVAGAASGAASLDQIEPGATPAATLERVAPLLFAALGRFDAHGFAAFAAQFAARDVLRGRGVIAAAGETTGIAVGVRDDGALLVENERGIVAITSGEWRLRINEPESSPC